MLAFGLFGHMGSRVLVPIVDFVQDSYVLYGSQSGQGRGSHL